MLVEEDPSGPTATGGIYTEKDLELDRMALLFNYSVPTFPRLLTKNSSRLILGTLSSSLPRHCHPDFPNGGFIGQPEPSTITPTFLQRMRGNILMP
jgi:hypothetical protein